MKFSREELMNGRALVKRLKEKHWSKIDLRDQTFSAQPESLVGQSFLQHITLKSIDALIIRKMPGGWGANITMKGLPVGVPNVLGTPDAHPLPSAAEARDAGEHMLLSFLRAAKENSIAHYDNKEQPDRVFSLHGYEISIPGKAVDAITPLMMLMDQDGPEAKDDARHRLSLNLTEIMGEDTFIPENWNAAPDDQKMKVLANMVTLLNLGVHRYQGISSEYNQGPT